jgi:hypothetical protein
MKSGHHVPYVLAVVVLVCSLKPTPTQAQFSQQGPKLVGAGAVGTLPANQGLSVSLSGDRTTAIVGGPFDNDQVGAAWVYTRSDRVWSQQGSKIVGTGAVGSAQQAVSVSLSGDGKTAIVGGDLDASAIGAAWVFTRSDGVWSQQGFRLVGSDVIGQVAQQGWSVALSGDGNTAIVGGISDNQSAGGNSVGAAWVFTRSPSGGWTQQAKLVGTGGELNADQGYSVSLSGDGNTAIVGGPFANAAWVFSPSPSGKWTQQAKLVATDAAGFALQGSSVSLSDDGNTAIVGGPTDNIGVGAAWVFTRSGGLWSQQGDKLVGTGAVGAFVFQGRSVSLSGDGNTAIVGGSEDNGGLGAAWVYTRLHGVWTQPQAKLVGAGAAGFSNQGFSVSLSGDGNYAVVGGPYDNGNPGLGIGAAWIYVKFSGTPGIATCVGVSVQSLARYFRGINAAAAALGYPSVQALQEAITAFCEG